MGMFKEQAHVLEDMYRRQTQVWPDSADHGIDFNDMTLEEIERMRTAIATLLNLPGSAITWRAERPAVQRKYRLVIMWGRAHGQLYDATVYDVLFYHGNGRRLFTIDQRQCLVNQNGEDA